MNTISVDEIWEQSRQILTNLEDTKSPLAQAYFEYLVPVSLNEDQLIFSVSLLQAKKWIEDRYLPFIKDAVTAVTGTPLTITLIIDESASLKKGASERTSTPSQGTTSSQASMVTPSQTSFSPSSTAAQPAVSVATIPLQSTQQFASITADASLSSSSGVATAVATAPPVVQTEAAGSSGLTSVFAPDEETQSPPVVESGSRFTFSNYVIGDSNRFAYNASLGVAERPGLYVNPLFIYGKSGLGKTHLLLSIKDYINTCIPDKRVVYAPTTEFVNDFTNAMAGVNDLTSFKRKYNTCDVLLIDDVQSLEGKEGTTNALFEIFNLFIDQKKQIVLSADRSPEEINLDERFTSRFKQGVTVDVQPPNPEMKAAILKNFKRYYCNHLNIPEVEFSDEATYKIADLSGSNIRELEGAVSNLILYMSCRSDGQKPSPITEEDVENILGKSFFNKNTRRVDFNMVMNAVESFYNISHAELLSEKRSKNISHPRQVAMYLVRRYTDMSYPEIGSSFNKDHTTVMYADRNIQSKMVEEAGVKSEVDRIVDMLTS